SVGPLRTKVLRLSLTQRSLGAACVVPARHSASKPNAPARERRVKGKERAGERDMSIETSHAIKEKKAQQTDRGKPAQITRLGRPWCPARATSGWEHRKPNKFRERDSPLVADRDGRRTPQHMAKGLQDGAAFCLGQRPGKPG